MTVTNQEILTEATTRDRSLVVSDYESLPLELQQDWELLRRKYTEEHMDWHVPTDKDAYDEDPATLQLITAEGQKGIIAGMRLTPRGSIKETLSWTMLPGLTDEQARGIDGPVWDLTRLVPGDIDRHRIMPAFAELFGAALAQTQGIDSNPQWIFATTSSFVNAFKRYGIEFTVIDGTEREGGILCRAFPVERTKFLSDHKDDYPEAYLNVMNGIRRINPDFKI